MTTTARRARGLRALHDSVCPSCGRIILRGTAIKPTMPPEHTTCLR